MNMHLYFNGDSFVAGSELADDLIPNHPGYAEYIESLKNLSSERVKWYHDSFNSDFRKTNHSKIIELERQRAFPSKVAKLLNIPMTNNAKNGCSMDRIARTTISDLLELKRTTNNIVAFISTTHFSRSEIAIIDEYNPTNPKLRWKCLNLGWQGNKKESEEIQSIIKYKVENENDYHGLINFYKNVILIQNFCKLNDIKLFWIAAANHYPNRISIRTKVIQDKKDYFDLKDYANIEYCLDIMDCYKQNFQGQKVVCPGGHFAEPVHDYIASKLAEIIKNI